MMFLLQLHRDLTPYQKYREALGSLYSLEIPAKEINKFAFEYGRISMGPVNRYDKSEEWIEESLAKIGIEVKWV